MPDYTFGPLLLSANVLTFLLCDAMQARYMLSQYVRLSQVGVPPRWLNLGSCKQHCTIAQTI